MSPISCAECLPPCIKQCWWTTTVMVRFGGTDPQMTVVLHMSPKNGIRGEHMKNKKKNCCAEQKFLKRNYAGGMFLLTKSAFALIELLVVLLIIGILSAIALPQYRHAVEKARAIEGIQLVKLVMKAQQMYYLENDAWATSFDDLSVGVPLTPSPWKDWGNAYPYYNMGGGASAYDDRWRVLMRGFRIMVVRRDGKYRNAGFFQYMNSASETASPVYCTGMDGIAQTYCEGVLGGTKLSETFGTSSRYTYYQFVL